MSVSFKYWDDCVDPEDMQSMWMDAAVSKEWIDAGERMGQKVHLSRDPDGEPYLTQTELKAVAEIIVQRHFNSQLDRDMLCAVAEIASDRILLIENYDKKKKESTFGLMQIAPEVAEWLARYVSATSVLNMCLFGLASIFCFWLQPPFAVEGSRNGILRPKSSSSNFGASVSVTKMLRGRKSAM